MKKAAVFLFFAVTVGIAWYFSTNSNLVSNTLSYSILNKILSIFPGLSANHSSVGLSSDELNYMLRKMAHFTEYFVVGLGAFAFYSMLTPKIRYFATLSLFSCLLVSCVDEFVLQVIYKRHPLFSDVGIDVAGAALGILICSFFYWVARRIRIAHAVPK